MTLAEGKADKKVMSVEKFPNKKLKICSREAITSLKLLWSVLGLGHTYVQAPNHMVEPLLK